MKKLVLLILSIVACYHLNAAVLSVTSTDDTNTAGTLRYAINNAASGDVIDITTSGTIILTSNLVVSYKNLTIQCSNSAGITISGNNAYTLFEIQLNTESVTLKNLNLINGFSNSGNAGGIFAYSSGASTLTLEGCTIANCSTSGSEAYGGALATTTNLVMTNCTLTGNVAEDGAGAISINDASSTATINHCTIVGNSTPASSETGGVDAYLSPNVTIQNSIVANNQAAGVINNFNALTASGGMITSLGGNLSDGSIPKAIASDLPSKNLSTQMKLKTLANNGGGVQTIALSVGSIAVDAATGNAVADARGNSRDVLPDIGAYEFIQPTNTALDATLISTTSAQLNGQVVLNNNTVSDYQFEYGTSTGSYPTTVNATTSGDDTKTLSASISSLTPGQTYYYRVKITVDGGLFYSAEKSFQATKINQFITFNSLPDDKVYGDADFDLTASSNSGLVVSYNSSDTDIATIIGSKLHLKSAGTVIITASQSGSSQYNAATSVDQSITIKKKSLTIKSDDKSRYFGEDNPTFTVQYTGFVNNETEAVLTALPTVTCSANSLSNEGEYDIIPDGAEADNYTFLYVNGKLTILLTPTGIKDDNVDPVTISPNPSVGILNIYGCENEPNTRIEIRDLTGKTILPLQLWNRLPINISDQPNGIYILSIHYLHHVKIVKVVKK